LDPEVHETIRVAVKHELILAMGRQANPPIFGPTTIGQTNLDSKTFFSELKTDSTAVLRNVTRIDIEVATACGLWKTKTDAMNLVLEKARERLISESNLDTNIAVLHTILRKSVLKALKAKYVVNNCSDQGGSIATDPVLVMV
jgi:hypothetical protein